MPTGSHYSNVVFIRRQRYWSAVPARPTDGTPYAAAHAEGKRALRTLALDTASTLLEQHGPVALTMRRIAAEMGCSTTVLYTIFGGKSGIAETLWREGFARLRTALAEARGPDPLARLAAMGHAYRRNALANRAYYSIMFQRPIPGFQPSEQARAESLEPLNVLADAVADCLDAGVFERGAPDYIARVLWAASHGAVSLELADYEGATDAEQRFDDLIGAAAAWFMPAHPARPDVPAPRPRP